jgi:thiazole synthase
MSWSIGGKELQSRLMIGSARYPSPANMAAAVTASGAEVITVSLRRENPREKKGQAFWDLVKGLDLHVLPNTSGCFALDETLTVAEMARELFETDWIKVEVIGDDYTLQPDPFLLVEACRELVKRGFVVFPYMTDDLVLAKKLVDVGCDILMPWAAPIGSGQGVRDEDALQLLRERFPEVKLLVDAGIGVPSHAARAMELGCDAVLLNTAIAKAADPVKMAGAFKHAVEAGRLAYQAGAMEPVRFATASSPTVGVPFWRNDAD